MSGIRVSKLRLAGTSGSERTYGVNFSPAGASSGFRPLSVIAGPSQTGKSTILDFLRYGLGAKTHPQHEEIIKYVRAAVLELELNGAPAVIERAATGEPSRFASVWESALSEIGGNPATPMPIEPTSDPEGLSQYLLEACDLDGIILADSSLNDDSGTQTLSIRDVFNVMFVPNERLDNKSLVFEQGHFMVAQKYRQTIDAMFGVHDSEDALLTQRLRTAREKARAAEVRASTLHSLAETDHPRGALQLQLDLDEAETSLSRLSAELEALDAEQRSTQDASHSLRDALQMAERAAKEARIRVRDRRSLIERLDSLRGQYADDQRKLIFLLEAKQLFDPLHVTTCPACLQLLDAPATFAESECSLCSRSTEGDGGELDSAEKQFIEAELRAVKARLKSLNEYVARLETHQRELMSQQIDAELTAEAAASAVDAIVDSPAPWLALRDSVTDRMSDARLAYQRAKTGVDVWGRVQIAADRAESLAEQARLIRTQRREIRDRPDRSRVVSALSARFGEILHEIDYPKLSNPYVGDDLIPHVRGLPYSQASSGGMVVIGLAWNLALWQLAHEQSASAPGLLVIDSPQKNLGHNSKPGDTDFADARLVDAFYRHVKSWLHGDGQGAQMIVVDNSPPAIVDEDVVVRFTRDPDLPPYGLIPEATE